MSSHCSSSPPHSYHPSFSHTCLVSLCSSLCLSYTFCLSVVSWCNWGRGLTQPDLNHLDEVIFSASPQPHPGCNNSFFISLLPSWLFCRHQHRYISIVTPDTTITSRVCRMCSFGVSQKILKYLMEGLPQQSLFYLRPGIQYQPNMTTGATHRNWWWTHLAQTQSSFSESAASGNSGSLKIIKILNIRTLLTQPVISLSRHSILTVYDHRSHP